MKISIFLATAFLLLSFLNIVEFDLIRFWQASVLTREFGHWFFLLAVLGLVRVWQARSNYGRHELRWLLGSLLISGILFARPVYEALKNREAFRQELISLAQQGMTFEANAEPGALFRLRDVLRSPLLSQSFERIEFKSPEGADLHFDFYRAVQAPAPLVVIIHGGSWEGGSTQQLPALNQELVHAGYAVASVSYRFSPDTRWPGQQDDVNASLDEIRRRADELGVDLQKIALLGRSAGSQIAGRVAYTRKDLSIRALVGFYGPTDLKFGYEITQDNDILDSRNLLIRFLGGSPIQAPENYAKASVIGAASERPVPTLLLYGEDDRLVWFKHGERLKYELQSRKVPVAFISMPWGVHGFDFNPNGPGGQIGRNSVLFFLRQAFVAAD